MANRYIQNCLTRRYQGVTDQHCDEKTTCTVCQGFCDKVPKMGNLKNRNLLSHNSGGQVKVSAVLGPSEGGEKESVPSLTLPSRGFLAFLLFLV